MEQIIECTNGVCCEKLFDESGALIYDSCEYGLAL